MNKIPNRQAICEVLMKHAETDKDIVVLCSDSRGSASLTPFANAYPEQFVEMGIAEQDLVSVSAGLAKCGKKAFAASPACFLSTRSYEQAKIDCAYSNTHPVSLTICRCGRSVRRSKCPSPSKSSAFVPCVLWSIPMIYLFSIFPAPFLKFYKYPDPHLE